MLISLLPLIHLKQKNSNGEMSTALNALITFWELFAQLYNFLVILQSICTVLIEFGVLGQSVIAIN